MQQFLNEIDQCLLFFSSIWKKQHRSKDEAFNWMLFKEALMLPDPI